MHIARTAIPASTMAALVLAGVWLTGAGTAGMARAEAPAAHPTAHGLTVAILDLAEAPGLVPPPSPPRRPSWRTSFGSERQPEAAAHPATPPPIAALADVDVVLLQGARWAAPLRRMFPPRSWRLVVSRRILAPRAEAEAALSPSATAIAIRARPGLRITAREPGLRLGAAAHEAHAAPLVASTAVRIAAYGRVIWLASVALPADCTEGACAAGSGLEAWRTSKRSHGATTLVGGRLVAPRQAGAADAGPSPGCAAHRIESDLDATSVPPAPDSALDGGRGCLSIVRIDAALSAPASAPAAARAEAVAKSPAIP